jgi:hypothetical protein
MAEEKGPLKSAVELAMERLKKKDEEAGVTSRALSDQDKAAIAEVRNYYEAKLAQEDVLHQSKLRSATPRSRRFAGRRSPAEAGCRDRNPVNYPP